MAKRLGARAARPLRSQRRRWTATGPLAAEPGGRAARAPSDAVESLAAEHSGQHARAPSELARWRVLSWRPRRFRPGRAVAVLGGLGLVLLLAMLGSLVVAGPTGVDIPAGTVAAIVLQWLPIVHVPHVWNDDQVAIVLQVRLPKMLTAVLAGTALAIAGATFQGVFRNPLADPAVIGVSSGAALGAVLALLFPIATASAYAGFSLVSLAAFAGALAAVCGVYTLARAGGRVHVTSLLLAGFAISAACNAVTTLVMSLSSENQLQSMFFWLLGGLSGTTWDQLPAAAALILAGVLPLCLLGRLLNALALGDEQAAHLGLNPARGRLVLILCAALVAAVAVALCGIIGFVGLVVPHMARLLFGPDNRLLVPASALLGAAFLTGVDALARAFSPVLLNIGVVTALIGAPLFVVLLYRRHDYVF